MPRPCDRCKEEYYDEDQGDCVEYSYASGLLNWLCIDCRSNWLSTYMMHEELRLNYDKVNLRIDWLQLQLENGVDVKVEQAIKLLEERYIIEREFRELGKQWLKRMP